jgi:hypothetical protein
LARTVRVHHIDLVLTIAIGRKNDLTPIGAKMCGDIRIRRIIGEVGLVRPVGVHDIDLKGPVTGGLKHNLTAVRTEGRSSIDA